MMPTRTQVVAYTKSSKTLPAFFADNSEFEAAGKNATEISKSELLRHCLVPSNIQHLMHSYYNVKHNLYWLYSQKDNTHYFFPE